MKRAQIVMGIAQGVGAVVVDEVRMGRGRCLVGWHDWWYCRADAPNHDHRHCRRCGAEW